MKMILTGSLAVDRIMNFPGEFSEHILPDKIHQLNVSFNLTSFEERRGGTAANIAYTLSLLGERAHIVASAGNDFDEYKAYLDKQNIDTSGIEISRDTPTANCTIITDQSDNQITGFFMGAMGLTTHADLRSEDAKNTVVVLSPGNKEDMLTYTAQAREVGLRTIFDPGQTLPFLEVDEIRTLLDGAFMLTVNDYELGMIVQRTEMTEQEIASLVEVLVVTKGKEGSEITTEGNTVSVSACSVSNVVDPTGAGDAFRAGFLKGMSNGKGWKECAELGSVAASFAIAHYGTQEHTFTMEEFCERYKKNYNQDCSIH